MEYIDGRPIVDGEQPQALPPDEALQLARDSLRQEPRFQALLQRLNLRPAGAFVAH